MKIFAKYINKHMEHQDKIVPMIKLDCLVIEKLEGLVKNKQIKDSGMGY